MAELAFKVEVLDDHSLRGQAVKIPEEEARWRFSNLVGASLGVIRKVQFLGVVSVRVLSDGAHEITVNTRTGIRDQERAPTAFDLKRSMREKAYMDVRTFALTADVSEAHQQVPFAKEDWHLLGWQAQPVLLFTFTRSAQSGWHRRPIGRQSQYFAGDSAHTWHMLVADDYHLDAGRGGRRGGNLSKRTSLSFFILCETCEVPLAWNKTAGGETVTWVGFELLHRSRQLGIITKQSRLGLALVA